MNEPSGYTAVFDSCVLFAEMTRNLLLNLAETGLFSAKWTADIHGEWISSLLARKPQIKQERLERLRQLMDMAIQDCLVTGYEPLIEGLSLPDPDDRHVLAAAITASADVIVTTNLKDFPVEALQPFHLVAQHPDEFIVNQITLSSASAGMVATALIRHKKSLTVSRPTWRKFFASLGRPEIGLVETFAIVTTPKFKAVIGATLKSGAWKPASSPIGSG